jgi:hypothetical protein
MGYRRIRANTAPSAVNLFSESEHTIVNRYLSASGLAAAVFFTSVPAAIAAHSTPLMKAAADLGYAYSYLGPEDAVALTKPGVTIVIRPGERLFDVNDRTEAMEGSAPVFSHSDIYISDALFSRLRQIAGKYPSQTSGERAIVVQNGSASANVTGAITGLTLSQVPGKQDINVWGKAPANVPITLTLIGTFTTEIPDVVISRNEVVSDADGSFKTDIPPASAFYRGAILTVVASSVTGVSSAKAQIVLKSPNGNVDVPNDQVQKSIR